MVWRTAEVWWMDGWSSHGAVMACGDVVLEMRQTIAYSPVLQPFRTQKHLLEISLKKRAILRAKESPSGRL
jgi:hypothetical protein